MIFIVTGCLAFIFLYFFDLNRIYFFRNYLNIFFALGVSFLVISTTGILLGAYERFYVPVYLQLIWGVLSLIALVLMVYSLFFALPFKHTYIEVKKESAIVETGMYALCRHPGVIWFFFFYLFLWLASGIEIMMWAGIIWTFMDTVYVYVQDRWIFPKMIKGYGSYKRQVPFLIPNLGSVKRVIAP